MTTTKHHSADPTPVTDMQEVRQRRATALLERRDELGRQWAVALSHGLPNAEDLAYEIEVVERRIGEAHPSVFDAHFSEWIVRDAGRLHEPGSTPASCEMCDVAHDGAA
jgi:hypothetical protein